MFLMRQEARLWVATYLSSSSSGHGFCPSSEKRNFALPASAILTDRLHGTPSLSTTRSRKPPCRSRVWHDGSGTNQVPDNRHCEEHLRRSNPACFAALWIASSRSLSSGAHSRDPSAPRNDVERAERLSGANHLQICTLPPPPS